jgi:hypothetical protein
MTTKPPQPESGGGFLSNLFSGKEGMLGKVILGAVLGLIVSLLFGEMFGDLFGDGLKMTGLLVAGGAVSGALSGGTGSRLLSGIKNFFGNLFSKKEDDAQTAQSQQPQQSVGSQYDNLRAPSTPAQTPPARGTGVTP